MHTQKYTRVRQDLNRLKFTETLHPDSVDLVAKMLKHIEDLYKKFSDKKRKETKVDVSSRMDTHQFDLLNQQYAALKTENEQLKLKMQDTGISQKIRLLQSKLRQCQIKYQAQLDQNIIKNNQYQKKVTQLTSLKECITEQNSRLKAQLQKIRIDNDRSCDDLTVLLEKKKKYIQNLQEQNSKYRLQINSLQRLYEQQKQYRNSSQDQNQKKSLQIIEVLKAQISDLQTKDQNNKQLLRNQQEKTAQLKYKVKQLNEQISMLQSQGNYVKQSCNLQVNAKQKIQSMLTHVQRQNEDLKDKLMNFQILKESNQKQIKIKDNKIKELSDKNSKIMNNNNRLQQEIETLNTNYTQKVRELRQTKNIETSLNLQIKQLQSSLKEAKQSEPVYRSNANLEAQYQKNVTTLQKQIDLLKNQMKIMQQNEHKILSQKNKLEAELKKLNFIIEEGNKQIQYGQSQKQNLFRQNKELRQTLQNFQNQGYSKSSQNIRMKDNLQSYQIMIEDLRVAVRNQQNINRSLNQKISQYQKKIQSMEDDYKSTKQDNKQLSLRTAAVQKQKTQIWEKYNLLKQTNVSKDSQNIEYVRQYNQLMHQKNMIQKKLKQKQRALVEIDNDRDQLQNILDDKTIQNAELQQKVAQLQKQLHNYGRGVNQKEMSLQGMQSTVKSLQYQLQKSQKTIMRLGQQLNQCQLTLNNRNLQCQQLNNQINILVLNNKDIEKNLQKNRQQIKNLQRRLKDSNCEVDQYRQSVQIYKIENKNLGEQLANQKIQAQKYYKYAQQAGQENNTMYHKLIEKDVEIKQLLEAVRKLQFTINQQQSQISRYEKQLRGLGEDLSRREEDFRRLQKDRDVYRAQAKNSMMRIPDMNDKLYLENKYDELQNDFMVKKMQCQNWRSQCHKLQKIIQEERYNSFMLSQRLQRLTNTPGISMSQISNRNSKYIQRQNHNLNILNKTVQQQHQTPIKMFQRSGLDSQISDDIEKSSVDQIHCRNNQSLSNSDAIQRSSINSKQMQLNLAEIQRQYNEAIIFRKH